MNFRYFLNVVTGAKRMLLKAGAREENCPYCSKITPIFRHTGYKTVSACLWCGESIDVHFCQICGKPFAEGEIPHISYQEGVCAGAHKRCLEQLLNDNAGMNRSLSEQRGEMCQHDFKLVVTTTGTVRGYNGASILFCKACRKYYISDYIWKRYEEISERELSEVVPEESLPMWLHYAGNQ